MCSVFLLKDERRSGQFIRKPPLVGPRSATRGAFLIIIPLITHNKGHNWQVQSSPMDFVHIMKFIPHPSWEILGDPVETTFRELCFAEHEMMMLRNACLPLVNIIIFSKVVFFIKCESLC